MSHDKSYLDVYLVFEKWAKEGLIDHKGPFSTREYSDFDVFILHSLGYKTNGSTERSVRVKEGAPMVPLRLTGDIRTGKFNIDWLEGPHGYALWRAMQIKNGVV